MSEQLYIRSDTGEVLNNEQRNSIFGLVKLLFRLKIINEDQVIAIVERYQILFV